MNNPLEDLMYRAGLTAQGCWDSMDDYDKRAVHKFAELIVRECANRLMQDDFGSVRGQMRIAGAKLKEHFGVEE